MALAEQFLHISKGIFKGLETNDLFLPLSRLGNGEGFSQPSELQND